MYCEGKNARIVKNGVEMSIRCQAQRDNSSRGNETKSNVSSQSDIYLLFNDSLSKSQCFIRYMNSFGVETVSHNHDIACTP